MRNRTQPPYLDVDEHGKTFLRAELEPVGGSEELSTLHAMVWFSSSDKRLQTHIPMWFVRVKDVGGNTLNLLLSAAEWDLDTLQLELDVCALERRGPGLLLDREQPNGSRLLVWSSASPTSAKER